MEIINEQAQPVHITLTKNTKGYQWELSICGADLEPTLELVYQADAQLKAKYGESQP